MQADEKRKDAIMQGNLLLQVYPEAKKSPVEVLGFRTLILTDKLLNRVVGVMEQCSLEGMLERSLYN